PPLTLVRPEPDEQSRDDVKPPETAETHPLEPPFAEAEQPPTPSPAVALLESRVGELEALVGRLQSETSREVSDLEGRLKERFGTLDERSEAEAARLRRADESLVEECARLRERIERLEEQALLFAKDFQELKRSLSELPATREPGELPLQLAPLLEERVRRE